MKKVYVVCGNGIRLITLRG